MDAVRSETTTNTSTRRVGRPHDPHIGDSLIAVAELTMLKTGYASLAVDHIVKAAGTTRPAFYRRFQSIDQLAFEVISRRFAPHSAVDTGSLESDLLELQRSELAMYSDPLFRTNLPSVLDTIRRDESLSQLYRDHFVSPRRKCVVQALERAAARGEIEPPGDRCGFVCDLLGGPMLLRVLIPTPEVTLSESYVGETVRVVMNYLTSSRSQE